MDFTEFKRHIYQHFGLYLDGYKEPQLKRRINSLMNLLQIPDYKTYMQLLIDDNHQWQRFIDKITINVSEFFRNPEIFTVLETGILPELLKVHTDLKIWSAACADGPEPYSVAILLDELAPKGNYHIKATDIDPGALAAAQKGVYCTRSVQSVTPVRLQRYFHKEGDNYFLDDRIKNMVSFCRHDLLRDNFDPGYHLILCRNVVIYFTGETQNDLYRRFFRSLVPGGFLFIGATESMFQYRELGFVKYAHCFYRRPEY